MANELEDQLIAPMNPEVVFQSVDEMQNISVSDDDEDDDYVEQDEDEDEDDLTASYKSWAKDNGIKVEDDVKIETKEDFDSKVADYYISKKYGESNEFLQLADKNVKFEEILIAYSQYEQILGMDDRDLYVSSQATTALQNQIKINPALANDEAAQQEMYNNAYNSYLEKIKGVDDEILKGLADKVREPYYEAKKNLIPDIQGKQKAIAEKQYEVYENNRKEVRELVKQKPYFVEKQSSEFLDYYDKMTAVENGQSLIEKKLFNDRDFFRKVIEFAYLDETDNLEKTFTRKTIKGKGSAPRLRNSKGSVGLRMIDTSKRH